MDRAAGGACKLAGFGVRSAQRSRVIQIISRHPIAWLAIGETLAWAAIFYSFPAMLLRWEADLGWSKAELTGAVTLAILAAALASPLAGRVIDRGHGAALMAGSAVLGGVGLLGLALVQQLWQFYVIWGVIGLATAGALYDPCFALVTRARGASAKAGIIWITLVAGFASTVSFPSVYGLSEAFGWRVCVLVFAGVMIGLVAPIYWFAVRGLERDMPVVPKGERAPSPRLRLHGSGVFWLLAAALACVALVQSAVMQHLLPIFREGGVSDASAVLAASFIGPMQVAGRLVLVALDRLVSHFVLMLGGILMMGASVLMLQVIGGGVGLLAGFVILHGCAKGTLSILRPLITRDVLGEADFGAKSGALALPFLVASASAPYLGAVIWGVGGYGLMLTLLAILSGCGAVFYVLAHRMGVRA